MFSVPFIIYKSFIPIWDERVSQNHPDKMGLISPNLEKGIEKNKR